MTESEDLAERRLSLLGSIAQAAYELKRIDRRVAFLQKQEVEDDQRKIKM